MNNKSTKGVEYDSDSIIPMVKHDSSSRYYEAGDTTMVH